MDSVMQDLRYAVRSLRQARGATVIALCCLALGIGANTAIFSVVRAVLLESLPYREPGRVVRVNEVGRGVGSVSGALYLDLRRQTRVFEDVGAFVMTERDLGDAGEPERIRGVRSTTNLFDVLGARPMLGRTFTGADAPPAGAPVVVLSEGLWRRRFGGDASLVGNTITLSDRRYTVIGIMPSRFDFPIGVERNAFWIPLDLETVGGTTDRNNRSLDVIARLAPGVDSAAAMASLDVLSRQLAAADPSAFKDRTILVRSALGAAVGRIRPALLLLLGAVVLVLLIACANVANLTLVRAAARRREIAIRTALGAERGRVVRQLLTESTLLGLVGGILGIGVAWVGLRALLGFASAILPRREAVGVDATVLGFAIAVSLCTGILFGLVPAMRASRADLRSDLADAAGRSSASAARHRTLDTLITAEVAISVVLLTGAGLAIRSFAALLSIDPGFRAEHVLSFTLGAPVGAIPDSLRYDRFFHPMLEQLRQLPGVRAAGMTSVLPAMGSTTDRFFQVVGQPVETDPNRRPDAEIRVVSPGYFKTMGIRLVSGRDLTDDDRATTDAVAVINEEMAHRFFAGQDPVGQRFTLGAAPITIVGVVASVRQVTVDRAPRPEFYLPAAQTTEHPSAMSFVVASSGNPDAIMRQVRIAVQSFAPRQPIYKLATMSRVISDSLGGQRLLLLLLAVFAGLALVLSAAGVYGVMSYGVTQRRREIGIRIALGASFANVTGLVLRRAASVALVGIAFGVVAAFTFARLMSSMLYDVSTHDAFTFAAVPFVIGAVALGASVIPAIRASRVDAAVAMRAE